MKNCALHRHVIHARRPSATSRRCTPRDDMMTPEIIERKRTQLKTKFYSIQRPMTENELHMILKPLFKDVNLELTVIKNKVYVVINNVLQRKNLDDETTLSIIDLINEWGVNDEFRRFLIKSLTSANKNNTYKYEKEVAWKCPLSIHYVFDEKKEENSSEGENDEGEEDGRLWV